MEMHTFGGINIIISPHLPAFVERPNKPFPAKQWHGNRGTGCYAERVRKKWLKRYGTTTVRHDFYAMKSNKYVLEIDTIICSRAHFALIKEALNDQKESNDNGQGAR